jgi:integrase/recombinase XerD
LLKKEWIFMRARYLSNAEIDKLSAHMSAEAWLPIRVACATGLRVGDIVNLRVWNLRENGIEYTAQKTGKRGFAPCPHSLIMSMFHQSHLGFCFPSKTKRGHITRQAVWARVKRACELSGVNPKGVSPHSFRKYFAVDLLSKSDLHTVQEALQHSSVYVTEQYAFSDWSTGENAFLSVKRCDIPLIIGQILPLLEQMIDKAIAKRYNNIGRNF